MVEKLVGRRWTVDSKTLTSIRPRSENIGLPEEAASDFLQQMFNAKGVEAVAFVSIKSGPAPTTLLIYVCTKLGQVNPETRETVMAVGKAKGRLSEQTNHIIPSGLRFFNTSNNTLNSIEERIREECKEDPTEQFLAFCVFDRRQSQENIV